STLRALGWFGGRHGRPGALGYRPAAGPLRLLLTRVDEVMLELQRGNPIPGLLAAPTRAPGHVDAVGLVDRMAAIEAAGATPWPWDLAQALLRVPEPTDPEAVARAATLVSPAGQRIAAALASGRPALSLATERVDVEPASRWHWRRPSV